MGGGVICQALREHNRDCGMFSIRLLQAAQNLVVLSREEAGAEQIFRNDGVKLIQRLLGSKQEELVLSSLRTMVGLCTGHQSRVSTWSCPSLRVLPSSESNDSI